MVLYFTAKKKAFNILSGRVHDLEQDVKFNSRSSLALKQIPLQQSVCFHESLFGGLKEGWKEIFLHFPCPAEPEFLQSINTGISFGSLLHFQIY